MDWPPNDKQPPECQFVHAFVWEKEVWVTAVDKFYNKVIQKRILGLIGGRGLHR
jgi:hypothetical protein